MDKHSQSHDSTQESCYNNTVYLNDLFTLNTYETFPEHDHNIFDDQNTVSDASNSKHTNESNHGNSNTRYKTKICHLFLTGKCRYGVKRCIYAHSFDELRLPPPIASGKRGKMCPMLHNTGVCFKSLYGDSCAFAHDICEVDTTYKRTLCKWHESEGGCFYGDKCRFAHGSDDLNMF